MKRVGSLWHVVFKSDGADVPVFLLKAMQDGVLDAVFKHVGKDGKDPHYHCLLRFKRPVGVPAYCPCDAVVVPCPSRKMFVFYGANEKENFI